MVSEQRWTYGPTRCHSQSEIRRKLCQVFLFCLGQPEFKYTKGGIRCICPNALDSSHIQVKAFCGGLYCFTRALENNSSIYSWLHVSIIATLWVPDHNRPVQKGMHCCSVQRLSWEEINHRPVLSIIVILRNMLTIYTCQNRLTLNFNEWHSNARCI